MKKTVAMILAALMLLSSVSALSDGLVAHYDFEDPTNPGRDISGNGNDLIVGGAGSATITDNAYAGNGALALDGTYTLTTPSTMDFTDGLTNFTISFTAIHQDYFNEVNRIISSGYNGCQCGMCFVLSDFGGVGPTFKAILGDSAQDMWGRMDSSVGGDFTQYHWYAVTYDAATQTVTAYVDGQMTARNRGVNVVTSCDAFGLSIGGQYVTWHGGIDNPFIGVVDDVRVYDHVIDINNIYTPVVKYYVKARPVNSRFDRNARANLDVTVGFYNSLGEFEKLYENFVNRVYIGGNEATGTLVDPRHYTVTRNACGTLNVSINADYIKANCPDGENSVVVYWQNEGYYTTAKFTAFAGSPAAPVGLVAHYDFEDAAKLGKDVSGNGHDLAIKGKGTPVASAEAAVGAGAMRLDGECALVTEAAAGDFSDAMTSYTLSFYAKHEGDVGEHYRVISTGYNGCQDGICNILGKYVADSGEHLVYQPIIGDSGQDFWGRMNEYTTLTEELDAYHWYVCSFDAKTRTMTAWIDGMLCGSVECVNPVVACDAFGFCLGGGYTSWTDTITQGFVGTLDDVRVYDYAIEDVSQIYGE